MNRFLFVGFLPASGGAKKSALEKLKAKEESLILFESPLRLLATLKEILAIWGDRRALVAREMTKVFEEFQRGTIGELIAIFARRAAIKGEVTIVVEGATRHEEYPEAELKRLVDEIIEQEGLSVSEAARQIGKKTGVAKSVIYRAALRKG